MLREGPGAWQLRVGAPQVQLFWLLSDGCAETPSTGLRPQDQKERPGLVRNQRDLAGTVSGSHLHAGQGTSRLCCFEAKSSRWTRLSGALPDGCCGRKCNGLVQHPGSFFECPFCMAKAGKGETTFPRLPCSQGSESLVEIGTGDLSEWERGRPQDIHLLA